MKKKAAMISAIQANGVNDQTVLSAMLTVPKHVFVSRNLIEEAYADRPLPIHCSQTISQPSIVALITQGAGITPRLKVLEIKPVTGMNDGLMRHPLMPFL